MTVSESANTQSQKSRLPLFIGIGCGVILLCILACISFYFFFIRGVGGESANTDTIEKVTLEFVTALHEKQLTDAQEMLSEKVRSNFSVNDLKLLSNDLPIATFQSLNVCEFQIIWGSLGKQLVGYGVYRFADGEVIFESTLLQNSDGKWQMAGFYFRPDLNKTPSGACIIKVPWNLP